MKTLNEIAYDSIRAGAPGLSDATCRVIAASISRKAKIVSPERVDDAAWIINDEAQNIDGAMLSWSACERIAKRVLGSSEDDPTP